MQIDSLKKINLKKTKNYPIGWKHKASPEAKKYTAKRLPDGGTRTLTLEVGKIYTVQQIIELSMALFDSNLAKILFQHSEIKLGYNNDESIDSFSINSKEVGFIDYYKLRSIPKPHLYLLTCSNPDNEELESKLEEYFNKENKEMESSVESDEQIEVLTETEDPINSKSYSLQQPPLNVQQDIQVPELKGDELVKFLQWKVDQYSKNTTSSEISEGANVDSKSKNLSCYESEATSANSKLSDLKNKDKSLEKTKLLKNISNSKAKSIMAINLKASQPLGLTSKLAHENDYFNSVEIQYFVFKESRYTGFLSISFRDRLNTAWHFHDKDENMELNIDINTFQPWDYGYEFGSIAINNKTLFRMNVDTLEETTTENINSKTLTKKFEFPCAKNECNHVIIHDVDEVVGFESNNLGIGVITSCTIKCRPYFKWFRNDEIFKEGFSLFWLSFIPAPAEMSEDFWHCEITCEEGCKSVSKKLKMNNNQIFSIELDVRRVEEISKSDFTISEEVIGYGQQGKVYKGVYKNQAVAVKKVISNPRNIKKITEEVKIVNCIQNHENFIHLYGVCFGEKHIFLIMELFDGKDLKSILADEDLMKKFDIDDDRKFCVGNQICKAIFYLHNQPQTIIHRDIKLENILLSKKGQVKICDFTLSKFSTSLTSLTCTSSGLEGSKLYMAPEIYLHLKTATIFSDIWATGCTILELYTEDSVWDIDSEKELREKLQNEETPSLEKLPDKLKEVIAKCFHHEPTARPLISDLVKAFN